MSENKIKRLAHIGVGVRKVGFTQSMVVLQHYMLHSIKTQPKYWLIWLGEIKMKIIQVGNLRKGTPAFDNPQTGRVYSVEGLSPTLNTCQGGGATTKSVG